MLIHPRNFLEYLLVISGIFRTFVPSIKLGYYALITLGQRGGGATILITTVGAE